MRDQEGQLIGGILKGDKLWIRKFEQQYRPRLLNFVLQKVSQYEDAEEIVQETFISAIYSLPSFSGKSCFWSWLCGIAKHEIADFYRKRKIKEVLFSRFPKLAQLASKALGPQTALEEKEIKQKILHCFLNLAEGYQDILRLKYMEGFSLRQIAQLLQKTVKAAEMRLRRARIAFAKNWNDQKNYSKNYPALNPRNLSFFKECLGLAGSSLPDLKNYQD